MRRWYMYLAVAVAFTIGVLIWLQQWQPAGEQPVRIGFNTWVGYGPLYVALDKGLYSKRGLTVALERMGGYG